MGSHRSPCRSRPTPNSLRRSQPTDRPRPVAARVACSVIATPRLRERTAPGRADPDLTARLNAALTYSVLVDYLETALDERASLQVTLIDALPRFVAGGVAGLDSPGRPAASDLRAHRGIPRSPRRLRPPNDQAAQPTMAVAPKSASPLLRRHLDVCGGRPPTDSAWPAARPLGNRQPTGLERSHGPSESDRPRRSDRGWWRYAVVGS